MTEKKTLSPAQLDQICRGLALLLHAGIGLNHGLFLLADDRQGWEKDILLQMGEKLDHAAENKGMPTQSRGILYLVLGLLGFGIVSYALMQDSLNKFA